MVEGPLRSALVVFLAIWVIFAAKMIILSVMLGN